MGLPLVDSQELEIRKNQITILKEVVYAYDPATEGIERGENLLRDIKASEVVISARKAEITRPLMDSLASVRDLFKPLEEGFAEAKKGVKEKLLTFSAAETARLEAERERVEKRVDRGTMRPDTAANKLMALDEQKTPMNTRLLKKVRIIDVTKIPREYLTPDMPKITQAVLKDGLTVDGVELYNETIIVTK